MTTLITLPEPSHLYHSRYAGQRGKLVGCSLALRLRHIAQKGGLKGFEIGSLI